MTYQNAMQQLMAPVSKGGITYTYAIKMAGTTYYTIKMDGAAYTIEPPEQAIAQVLPKYEVRMFAKCL